MQFLYAIEANREARWRNRAEKLLRAPWPARLLWPGGSWQTMDLVCRIVPFSVFISPTILNDNRPLKPPITRRD